MSTMNQVNELKNRRQIIEQGGKQGQKVIARQRIESLLDANSFVEIGAFIDHRTTDFNMGDKVTPADGVVTGYGTIEGRLVYVYSQDVTVMNGAVGEMHAKKIEAMYINAIKMGAPIIGVMDSEGLRLQEATDALDGYGRIVLQQTLASGVIPQISMIFGTCAGGATIMPGLSDFVFMCGKEAKMFVNSPSTMSLKQADMEMIGTPRVHSEITGSADVICNEESCFEEVRKLINFLPMCNKEEAPVLETKDDLNRIAENFDGILEQENYDVREIVKEVADEKCFYEINKEYAKAIVTGFIRLNGGTVGILANQGNTNEGRLDIRASRKASKFINKCDAFNIPIISFTDTKGFRCEVEEEQMGLTESMSKLVYAFSRATVPKVNIILRHAYGSAYIAMNSKHIGADMVYAWPSAEISVMNPNSAVNIIYGKEMRENNIDLEDALNQFNDKQASVYGAARRGYVDDIIEPALTRKRMIIAIEMLISKSVKGPAKKHGTVL